MPVSPQTLDDRPMLSAFERNNDPLGGRDHMRIFDTGQKDTDGKPVRHRRIEGQPWALSKTVLDGEGQLAAEQLGARVAERAIHRPRASVSLLDQRHAMRVTGLSRIVLRDAIASGALPAKRDGGRGHWRVRPGELASWLALSSPPYRRDAAGLSRTLTPTEAAEQAGAQMDELLADIQSGSLVALGERSLIPRRAFDDWRRARGSLASRAAPVRVNVPSGMVGVLEAAALAGVKANDLYGEMKKGRLTGRQLSGRDYIDEDSLQVWLKGRAPAAKRFAREGKLTVLEPAAAAGVPASVISPTGSSLTLSSAASLLGLSRKTLVTTILSGALPAKAVYCGTYIRSYKIDEADLQIWMSGYRIADGAVVGETSTIQEAAARFRIQEERLLRSVLDGQLPIRLSPKGERVPPRYVLDGSDLVP